MGSLRLRTMAMKSVFDSGKYKDLSVVQLLSLNHHTYIRYCYYTYDKISFTEDVLNQVNITPEFRITKPGKDLEIFDKFKQHMILIRQDIVANMDDIDRIKKYSKKRSRSKKMKAVISINKSISSDHFNKKSVLQGKNHGR